MFLSVCLPVCMSACLPGCLPGWLVSLSLSLPLSLSFTLLCAYFRRRCDETTRQGRLQRIRFNKFRVQGLEFRAYGSELQVWVQGWG